MHNQKRWTGAIYMGGYAIECSLKSLICFEEGKSNLKNTNPFQQGLTGSELHSLSKLLNCLPDLQRCIKLDRTNIYQKAWNNITTLWRNDELRYSDKVGNEKDSVRFIESVKTLHRYILERQGES